MVLTAVAITPAEAGVSYRNCTAFHRTYPHGVGKAGARDRTIGKPVTTFKHSTRLNTERCARTTTWTVTRTASPARSGNRSTAAQNDC
jgi:hypothetical protein